MLSKPFICKTAALAFFLLSFTHASAHPATGIVVDKQGRVYFSDLETVWKLDPQGSISLFRDGVGGRHVHELHIDGDGNVYGADLSYDAATGKYSNAVWKMTSDGKLTWVQGPSTVPRPGMDVWIDRTGNMYSIDQNNHTKTRTLLLRRAPDGTVTTLAGGAYGHADGQGTAAMFSSVGGMTFGPDGSLYLTDGTSVRKVTMDGKVTTIARDLESLGREAQVSGDSQSRLTGLAVDAAENVYVADAGRRRLLRVKSDGKVDVVHGTESPFFPNGVFVGPDGAIYVLEVGWTAQNTQVGPRVRKISADGRTNVVLVALGEDPRDALSQSSAKAAGRDRNFVFALSRTRALVISTIGVALLVTVLFVWWRRVGESRV